MAIEMDSLSPDNMGAVRMAFQIGWYRNKMIQDDKIFKNKNLDNGNNEIF